MLTIKDIAEKAGVSRGTVDRVIHHRGNVAEDKRQKVLQIVKDSGFRPNEYASLIATNKIHSIYCLIPQYFPGDVWEITAGGIRDAGKKAESFGVQVHIVTYDQYDIDSFRNACRSVLAHGPSGVVVAPMFRAGTLRFVRELSARDIPYVYIDTKLDDDGYLEFFGLPMYESGYLGADILTQRCRECIRTVLNVRIIRDKDMLSDPTMLRRAGFMDYIKEYLPLCEVRDAWITPNDETEIARVLDEQLATLPENQRNIIMFNSRVHLVASYIKSRGLTGCNVVGYDMLRSNIQAMKDGTVNFIIAQHSDLQAANAVRTLAEHLAFRRPVVRKDHYSQMDILNRHNCDYYTL